MFKRLCLAILATAMLFGTLVMSPAVAGAVENDWEFYGEWGVTDMATDRQTRNNIYVYEIENINGVVYIGGAFQKVVHRDAPNQPIDQAFIVAFDAASGDIISSFRPEINHPVYAISEHPTTGSILVGGEFTTVNGQDRTALVALDPDTGATDPSFTGSVSRQSGNWRAMVRGIDDDGENIYVGGSFGRAEGIAGSHGRQNVAKFKPNGRVDPVWNVHVTGGGVWDLIMSTDDQRVIFGGLLNRVNGVSRPGLAMVSASGVGALTSAFPNWQGVSNYCYGGYPGCILVYDLDVQDGKLLVSAAEHFSSLHNDTTGQRIHVWAESNDTQAGLLDGDMVWRSRHGGDNGVGVYYAHSLTNYQPLVTTSNRVSVGAGGFEIEKGENGCVWIGGAIGGMDLANIPGSQKVGVFNVGFMCPPGTNVPESQLDINNWDVPPGLLIRRLHLDDKGGTYGVYSYTPAPDAVTHEIFLDGELVGLDDDGSFAFSHLEASTTYAVKVRATDADGETLSVTSTFTTSVAGAGEETVPHDDPFVIPNLNVHNFVQTDVGRTYGVFTYDEAPDAVRHEVYLDGNFVGSDDDGSFAFSHLEPASTYEVELRAIDSDGLKKSQRITFTTRSVASERVDNVAGVSVSQVNDYTSSYSASKANDENTGNTSITKSTQEAWWQIDLGSSQSLAKLELWARNGAANQARDVHVLVSDQPFTSDSLADAQAQSSVDVFLAGNGARPKTVDLDTTGRYVRLQLAGTYYLSIAEVDIWSAAAVGEETVPHGDPFVIPNLNVHNFVQTDVGRTYGVFSYDGAADAVRHEVYLDGNLVGTDDDGSFAFAHLEPASTYEVELRAIDADGLKKSQTLTLTTSGLGSGERVDNVAGVSVSQINDYSTSYSASKANDENTGNTSITKSTQEAWWQIDLGSSQSLAKLELWARNGAANQARDVHVLVSDQPFTSDSLADAQAQSSVDVFLAGNGARPKTVDLNATGRYVRLQLAGTYYLSIAEVDIWAAADNGEETVPHGDPFAIPNLNVHNFRQTDVSHSYGVFSYDGAADAVRHEVYLDGNLVGTDDDGSFAISQLEPSTSYEVELRAIDADGLKKSQTLTLTTSGLGSGERVDNVAGVSVSQINNYTSSYPASKANDENTGNTSITKNTQEAWWQIDLGSSQSLAKLELWARSGAVNQARDVHVLVSDQPFTSDSLADAQAQSSVDVFLAGNGARPKTADLNTTGRYVRLQLAGTYYLSIAEVDIWAVVDAGEETVPHPNPFPGGEPEPPVVGDLVCVLDIDGSNVDVNWTGTTGAESIIVYRSRDGGNRFWRGKVPAGDGSFADALGNATYTYEITERSGNDFGDTFECGDTGEPPPPPPADLVCEVELDDGAPVISWTGEGQDADSVIIYRSRNGGSSFWRGKVDGGVGTFTDTAQTASYVYQVREKTGAVFSEYVDCGSVVVGPADPQGPTLTCSVDIVAGDAVVTLAGQTDADSVVIFRSLNGGANFWRGKIDAGDTSFTDTLRTGSFNYEIRERTGGVNSDAVDCGSVEG